MMPDGLSSPSSAQYLLPLRRTSIGSTPPPKEPIKLKDPDASSRARGLLYSTASAGRGGATPLRRLVDKDPQSMDGRGELSGPGGSAGGFVEEGLAMPWVTHKSQKTSH